MKNFKFKYENILTLYKKNETSIKNKLNFANNELSLQKSHLEKLINMEKTYFDIIKDKLISGCKLNEVRNVNCYKSDIKNLIHNQNKKIEETEKKISLIKNELLEASKEVKIIEKLKERDYNRYIIEYKLDEEKTIDQIVTYSNSLRR